MPQTKTEQRPSERGHIQTNQGSHRVAKEPPVTVHSPPHTSDTEQQPPTGEDRLQTVWGPPQVVEEPSVTVHSLLHTRDTEQQLPTDRDRPLTVQRPPRVAEEPPVTVQSPPHTKAEYQSQTDRDHLQIVQGSPEAVEESPAVVHPSPQTSAEEPSRGNTEHPTTVRRPQVAEESPAILHPLPQASTKQPHRRDTEHSLIVQAPPHLFEDPRATVRVEDLETDDVVIAVMGPTGSGKSTFVRLASGRDIQGVGHSLKSFTSHVIAIRYLDQESGRHIVLVDTPGFDDTFLSDLEILNMISDWLNSSYKKEKLLSGILYLHRITDNRMAGTPLKNLRVFRKLCGKDALDKVHLTTTMWDEVELRIGERRLEELRTEYWRSMIIQGAQMARCRNDDDSPKQIVQQIIGQEAARKAVLLQEEMADLKKELKETEAGQELYSQLEKLVERQTVLLQRIDKERKSASDAMVLAELQTEYNDLRVQIDDRLRQMQELKLSRLKNILRFFSRRRE